MGFVFVVFVFYLGRFSLLGSRKVQTGALQRLEEEKVQQLYLNWGSVNWLTHALI